MTAIVNHFARRYLAQTCTPPKGGKVQVVGPSGVSPIPDGGFKIYRNISCFIMFPILALCAVHCYLGHQAHGDHRPEFVKYEYLRIRTKRFPWGDGTRTLFHNKHTNPLPDGYED